ncbi:MAG: hypothetical protein DWQ18_01445 [Crenarchaeota archaeon]|nr:MAG: hypothetical protein DWQ17_03770 [Thermoproteota archaeon]RDJ34624.1 MAG: hypothetical protein DWQ18_01445 [Thermoproteota archaeon]RDJ34709.1 MAG: hypothetical protein DWQ19_14130 [Thermoproteota archaeon]RDJ38432.1 MAG: hypothetical protein DWQ13_03375 [Thermoproteota archaeon]
MNKVITVPSFFLFVLIFCLVQNVYASEIQFDQNVYPIPNDGSELKISIRVIDQDFNISPNGIDTIAQDVTGEPGVGPIKISVVRGESVVLGYAGGEKSNNGKIDSHPLASTPEEKAKVRQFGPIQEISPQSGIFEFEIRLRNTDGPQSSKCPTIITFSGIKEGDGSSEVRFDDTVGSSQHCILQGDVIKVEYSDPVDYSGNSRRVTDSATFGLANPSIESSSTSFRIGHPFTLVLSDNDLNLDSEKAESYSLGLISFRSDKIRISLGDRKAIDAFEPRPSVLRETGENTGLFYTVLKIPRTIDGKIIHIGEEIEFEYRDGSTLASGYVGQNIEKFTLDGRTGIKDNYTTESIQDSFKSERSNRPPLEQHRKGVLIQNIQCPPDYELVLKKSNNTPACIKLENIESLVQRGWAKRI